MSIFLKLLLAHLIADFVIQFNVLYQLKLKNVWGHIWHALIHFVVTLLLVIPYLYEPLVWAFVAASGVIHLFQDIVKYKFMQALNKKLFFPIFMMDQLGHCLVLSSIFLFPISRLPVVPPPPFLEPTSNDGWILGAVAFLLLTVCGNYVLHAFGVSYLKHQRKNHYISRVELVHGMIERMGIGGVVLHFSNPVFCILAIGSGLARAFLPQLRSKVDFALSAIYAVIVAIALKFVSEF